LPGDLTDPKVGSTERCMINQNDGSSLGVTVTVTSVDGTDVKFDIKADNTAAPVSPTPSVVPTN